MSQAGGRGKYETELLRANIKDQLSRLMTQLEDLEELKDEFDDKDEFEETKQETLEQLKEFNVYLQKMLSGDMTLMTEFGSAQLAIQAAIQQGGRGAEVLRIFSQGDQDENRKRQEIAQMQQQSESRQFETADSGTLAGTNTQKALMREASVSIKKSAGKS